MLRALKASHENLDVKAHSQDLFSVVDLVGQLFLPADFAALASGRRDVEPAILPARPLSVITSAVNSFAVTWVPSVVGIGATRGCVLLLAGAFLGLHWCRHSAGAFLGLHWCRHSAGAFPGLHWCRHFAGAFLGLHWCRHSALCFASSLHKRIDTSRAIHRTTRSATRTFCLRLGLRV